MDMLPPADLSARDAQALFARIAANIEKVMRGQHESVRKLLAAFAAGGHVLLEDYPGTGKTTLAKALAASIGARFTRVQFTPDLLPSDILGVSVFNQKEQTFEFHAGPVFTHILLADEINRASPAHAVGAARSDGRGPGHGRRPHARAWTSCSSSSRRRTRSSSAAPIRCPKRRWTASRCASRSATSTPRRRSRCSRRRSSAIRSRAVAPCATREEVLALQGARAARARRATSCGATSSSSCARTRDAAVGRSSAAGRAPRSRSPAPRKALALFDGEEFVRPEHVQRAGGAGARAPPGARPAGAVRRRAAPRRSSPTSCARCRFRHRRADVARIVVSRAALALRRASHWLRERLTHAGLARARRGGGRRGGRRGHRRAPMSYQAFTLLAALLVARVRRGAVLPRRASTVHARAAALRHRGRAAAATASRSAQPRRAARSTGVTLREHVARPAARLRRMAAHARAGRASGATGSTATSGYFRWRWLIERRTCRAPRTRGRARALAPGARASS